MQLSLPIPSPIYPDPAAAGSANPDNALAALCGQATPDSTAASFEELLSPEDPPAPAVTEEDEPDAEKAASILAASFWMPALQQPQSMPSPADAELGIGPDQMPAGGSAQVTFCGKGGHRSMETPPDGTPVEPAAGGLVLPATASENAARAVLHYAASSSRAVNPGGRNAAPLIAPGLAVNKGNGPEAAPMAVESDLLPAPATDGLMPAQPTAEEALLAPSAITEVAAMQTGTGVVTPVPPKRTLATAVSPAESKSQADAAAGALASEEAALVDQITAQLNNEPLTATASQPAKGAGVTEKIAAVPTVNFENAPVPAGRDKKDFLRAAHASVTKAEGDVGIGVAQLPAAMSTATSNRSKSTPAVELASVVTVAPDRSPLFDFTASASVPVASVREAMATVLSAVEALEQRADAAQKSVNLQFHLGNEHLGLRVELRDGAVHATFRTNSAELRTALAQEWQSVVQPVGRELRLADPVFSSSSSGGADAASSSLGQGTPHRRHEHAAQTPAAFPAREFTSPAAPAAPAATTAPRTNALLHAFA